MRYYLLFLLLLGSLLSFAQKSNEYSKIDAVVAQIPDSSQQNTTVLARYIDIHFTIQTEKARAIFAWLANTIEYDIANMYNLNFKLSPGDIIEKTMKERKGICRGYAEVYYDVANKLGIKNYVIEGYTRQNDRVDYLPHAWIAVYLDTSWSFIDPTWGSGMIEDGEYKKHLNNFYFRTSPEKMIASHIAFDPLFQFLSYPVTSKEFITGLKNTDKNKSYFNFIDTLKVHEQLTEIQKLESSARRIEANGINNSLIFDRLQYLKRELEYQQNKIVVELYNGAVADFNQAVALLNNFIAYRNKQFNPTKPDNVIKQMVDTVETLMVSTNQKLSSIQNPDKANADIIIQMKNNMAQVQENLADQKAFVAKYLNTSRAFRKSLFYSFKSRVR